MLLYHGSYIEVKEPKIITSEFGRDFGFAFYLTPIKEQAERWAKRKAKENKIESGVVSIFEWNENTKYLNCKEFKNEDKEWLDLVIECRKDINYRHGYDIVQGKIADDTVGETVNFVIKGFMRKEDALKRLKYQKINYQIAFCTEKSLKTLTFKESYEVKNGTRIS